MTDNQPISNDEIDDLLAMPTDTVPMPAEKVKTPKNHYVDNGALLLAFEQWAAANEAAGEKLRMPEPIGAAILKIATHLSYKPQFINYSFREDMIADGIENCVKYVHNFNPEKTKNPFAYITQIVYYAFLHRILKEKKHSYIRSQLIKEMPFDSYDVSGSDESDDFKNAYNEYIMSNSNDVSYAPANKIKKKRGRKPKAAAVSVEDFL